MLHPFVRCAARGSARLLVLLVLLSGSACGKDATGSSQAVARIAIANTPEAPLLVGASLRLEVTASNAGGDVVVDPPLKWSSSEPSIASVGGDGTVLGQAPGVAEITVTSGSARSTISITVSEGAIIGPGGGVLHLSDGAMDLEIPAGAFLEDALVTIGPVDDLPDDGRLVRGSGYAVKLHAQFFDYSQLTIRFDPAALPPGLPVETVSLYMLNDDLSWSRRLDAVVDPVEYFVRSPIHASATYALRSMPVESIELVKAPQWGVLYAGATTELEVEIYADEIPVRPQPPLEWTSSDPGVLAVDDAGVVTARSPGSATITAGVDGQALEVPLTVLPAVEVDWSRVGDWSTFRGGPQHAGFVDAALDPSVFRELWTKEPILGQTLHPATTGEGALFLATEWGGSPQQILRVDAATGSVEASVDLGELTKLDQPTFHDGELIIVTTRWDTSFVSSLDARTLKPGFRTEFPSEIGRWAAPSVSGNRIVVGASGGVHAFERVTGAALFTVPTAAEHNWGPTFGLDGRVYAAGDGLVAVEADGGTVVARLNDSRFSSPVTPVIGRADRLYAIVDQSLIAVNLATMGIAWEEAGEYNGLPAAGNGVVFAASGNEVVARRESDGSLLWRWSAPVVQGSPQAVSLLATRNLLFAGVREVAGSGATYALDIATGIPVWSYPMGGHLALSRERLLHVTYESWIATLRVGF